MFYSTAYLMDDYFRCREAFYELAKEMRFAERGRPTVVLKGKLRKGKVSRITENSWYPDCHCFSDNLLD